MYNGMYDGLYYEHIEKVSVYDGVERIEIQLIFRTFQLILIISRLNRSKVEFLIKLQ